MTVKTLTAPTIAAALAEARRLFGEEVVLLESHPPDGARPARVTVAAEPVPAISADAASISRVIERVKQQPAPSFGYAGAGRSVDLTADDDAEGADGFSAAAVPTRGHARGRLFPTEGDKLRSLEPVGTREVTHDIERLLEQRLGTLHERLEGIEKRFDGHPASAGKWLRHPIFNRLLDRGLPPGSVADVFARATSHGDLADDEALYWALARTLRDQFQDCAPVPTVGTQVFTGISGAGKTSLILRLATQKAFYGRHRCGIVIVHPPSAAESVRPDATDLYRRAGLPVQNVRCEEEMEQALARLQGFDHVLVDTPGLPFRPRPMRDGLAALRPFMQRIVPAQTYLVLDATRAIEELDPDLIRRMPVAPDVVAVTHMDDTSQPGRIGAWLSRARLPVNVVSSSGSPHDGLAAFSPAGFAEQLLEA